MQDNFLTAKYWEDRYQDDNTGWDLGRVSPPLQHYFDSLTDKSISILIPGAGNAYEAEYLHRKGFSAVHVLDSAASPISNLLTRVPNYPIEHLHHCDFFKHDSHYDLIIEQTFFCALDPQLRTAYVDQMANLLKPNGLLVGLLFNFPDKKDGPPYGGDAKTYRALFQQKLEILELNMTSLSIKPRQGSELFFRVKRK